LNIFDHEVSALYNCHYRDHRLDGLLLPFDTCLSAAFTSRLADESPLEYFIRIAELIFLHLVWKTIEPGSG